MQTSVKKSVTTAGAVRPRLAGLVIAAWVAAAVGCANTPTASGTQLPSRAKATPMIGKAQKVYLVKPGPAETDDHLGWLTVTYHDTGSGEQTITYARNLETDVIGFFLDSGATYVYDENDVAESKGNHNLERSLQIIYQVDGIFRLADGV